MTPGTFEWSGLRDKFTSLYQSELKIFQMSIATKGTKGTKRGDQVVLVSKIAHNVMQSKVGTGCNLSLQKSRHLTMINSVLEQVLSHPSDYG